MKDINERPDTNSTSGLKKELNRSNYLRRQEELKKKAKDRYHSKKNSLKQAKVNDTDQGIISQNHQMQKNLDNTIMEEIPMIKNRHEFGTILRSLSSFFRICLVIFITGMEIFLLKNFIQHYDIFAGNSSLIATCTFACMISLLVITFKKNDFFRKSIYGFFFLSILSTQIFQIYDRARIQYELSQKSTSKVKSVQLNEQIKKVEEDLAWAKKEKSWDNVKAFADEVQKLRELRLNDPRPEETGVPERLSILISSLLLIVMRILFLSTSTLNILKLKEELVPYA